MRRKSAREHAYFAFQGGGLSVMLEPIFMFGIKLSTLSILLGLVMAVPNVYGVLRPSALAAAARKFPRHLTSGVVLMLLATVWFVYNVSQESLSDFAKMKTWFYALFGAVGIGSCLFVQDFLAVRGLAVVLLLLAKLMADTARAVDTEWRLVVIVWAYVFVIAGIWLTISPWRLRDLIEWSTATEARTRLLSSMRLAFALLVIALGLTVFRSVERTEAGSVRGAAPVSVAIGLGGGVAAGDTLKA